MFLKLITHTKDNQIATFILEHMDIDFVEDKLDSLLANAAADKDTFEHRMVLFHVRISGVKEKDLHGALNDPDNAHIIKSWYCGDISAIEESLTTFLSKHDINYLLTP